MRNVNTVTVRYWVSRLEGRYYDPDSKKEGSGIVPTGCVPLEKPTEVREKVVYKVKKEIIEKYGEKVVSS